MNKTQRLKAHHLNLCRLLPGTFDTRFIRAMAWLSEHDQSHVLSKKQKFVMDQLIYRYRAQLASRMPHELMIDTLPDPKDYGMDDDTQADGTVNDLFDGKPSRPHPSSTEPSEKHPQATLI